LGQHFAQGCLLTPLLKLAMGGLVVGIALQQAGPLGVEAP
jgi:hypothetical protein